MHLTTRLAALALGASMITGGALAVSAGAATAKPKLPATTVKQVNDQVQLVVQDEMDARDAYIKLLDMPQTQSICQGQLEHVAALRAMVRPTRYPTAAWKNLMRGAGLIATAASECGAAAQAFTDSGDSSGYRSGFHKFNDDWNAGNALFDKASNALAKAKIR
jgi:hypothetical protein